MAFKCQPCIFPGHAMSVIFNSDIGLTADADLNIDLGRSGINGILDQFFDDRSRTFDNFTSGNMVCNIRLIAVSPC